MADETDLRLRHLDTLQGVITRLSQHSFTVRGWSVTLVSVVFAILSSRKDSATPLLFVALAPAWIFWGLDAYYLRQERLFRRLFTAAAHRLRDAGAPDVAPFDMDTTPYRRGAADWSTIWTPSVAAVPAVLTLAVLGYATFAR